MIAPEYFNNHIAVEGEIVVKRVPNDTGSVLVWNSTTKKISTRTVGEIVSDLNVLTTNTNQLVTGQKYFVTTGGNHAPTNNALQIYADDGSLPSMTYSKGGSYVGQVMFDEGGFHFKNGDNNNYYGITAGGFKKDGYNNNFALLAGGGQLALSELSKTNHTHNSLENINFFQSSDLNNELEAGKFKFRPAVMSNSPNIFPNPHNANAILSISTWSDAVYGHDLGFSGDGNIYHRSRDTGGIYQWNKILTDGNIGLPNFSNFVTTNIPQDIPVKKSFSGSTGNAYDSVALELKGNGTSDTIYPAISFHQPGLYAATLQYRANGYHFMNINGNAFDYVRAAGYFKDGSSDNFFLTGGGNDYDSRRKEDSWFHSGRNFPQGTLIETDIDYSVTNGDQFLLEMKGNMYGGGDPLIANIQGYIYFGTLYSTSGYSNLYYWNHITALNLNGKLCFWFQSLSYWQGFDVKVTVGFGGLEQGRNRVTSVSDNPDPGGTKRVEINLKHLLTKEDLISGNTFWEKKDIGNYWALDSDKPIAGLNGNGAQVILSGGLLASSSYTDSQFIPTDGIHSRGFVQSDEGFQNRYWKADQRNRIWSFANSDGHGLSYFQGSGHVLGEGINFHFGDASSTGYKTFVQNSGRIFSAVDGNSGDWKHKEYDANNYLGADYVGGGQEKPNSRYFGAGKLKLQMLEATQMGNSNFGWSDVLWMSSYAGGDVKKSTAIVSSKYSDRIGFVKQDYDAADWGTFQEFWTTNNLTNPATQTDLDNYYHINKGVGVSNQSELVPNGLQSISVGNSGSNFDGELANKTLEGTFANFNGYSKTSKDLGFTLFAPTSTGQGVYYKTWYGGNQTTWKRLAEHSDLSGYTKSFENAHAVGFSSGLSTAAPYIYHSADGYVFLATQTWANSKFVNVDGQQDITGLKIIKGRAKNTGTGWGNTSTSTDYSFLVETESGSNADNQYTGSIGFFSNSGAQAGIYVRSNDNNGTSMAFATTNMFSAGPQIAMTIDNQGTVDHVRSRPTFQGNVIWDAGNLTTTMVSNWNDKFKNLKYVADVNLVSESGIYRQEGPISGFSYTTTLNLNSSDGRQQLTIERGGGGMKFRGTTTGSGNSNWSDWNEVYHTGNFNPASYVTQSTLNTQLGNYATLVGVQTFTNTNTFSQSPIVPAGTLSSHAVNRSQLDNLQNWVSQNYVDAPDGYSAIISGQDLNNIKNTGFYRGSGLANAPNTGWFFVIVEGHDSSWVKQTVTTYGSGNTANMTYERVMSGGAWSTWYQVWSTRDFSQNSVNNWNYMSNYGVIVNQQFTNNTGNGLIVVDDYVGGESGIYNEKDKSYLAVLQDKYYKYSSSYKDWEGINFNLENKNIGIGTEANDVDKVNVLGSVKATENFKSKHEEPNTLFIPDGNLAYLNDEITNEDYRMRLSHKMIEQQSGVSHYDSDNRMLVIRCTDPGTPFVLGKCFPGQRILVLNAHDSYAQVFEIKNVGVSYKIKPYSSIQLFVWEDMSVYKYAENQMY